MSHDTVRGRNPVIQRTPDPSPSEEATSRGGVNLPAGYLAHYGLGRDPLQRKRGAQGEGGGDGGGGSGQAMPDGVQAKFENAFQRDFSDVRVHEGSSGPQAVGALAYTQGTDIHFAPGLYSPHSHQGQELLGHELTHVVQQSEGRVGATTQNKGVAINDDSSLEQEADTLGAKAARGESVYRSGISDFQSSHSPSSIREGQGRVLGHAPVQNKKDSSGVLQCYPGGGSSFSPPTGRKVTTINGTGGEWKINAGLVTVPKDGKDGEYEIDVDLKLGEIAKDSKNVRFVQSVRRGTTGNNWATKATDPGMGADRASRAAEGGWRVDRADPSAAKTPFYGHNMGGKGGTLQNTGTAAPGQYGGALVHLWDKPAVVDPGMLEFSTNAMDETTGVSYGSVGWGFVYDSSTSTYKEETPRLLKDGDPRLAGQAAAYKKWNQVYGPSGTRDKNVNQVPIAPTAPTHSAIKDGNDGIMPTGDSRVA